MANFIKQISTATSGTVNIGDTKQDIQLIHNAVSLAVTLTIAFPANPVDAQRFGFCSVLGVTTLTLSSALSIIGGITVLAAAAYATYMYEASTNKWYRIG
jgi:hypothetical protein